MYIPPMLADAHSEAESKACPKSSDSACLVGMLMGCDGGECARIAAAVVNTGDSATDAPERANQPPRSRSALPALRSSRAAAKLGSAAKLDSSNAQGNRILEIADSY